MPSVRVHRRFAAWIAALAILVAALAPSISMALGSARGDLLIEVCTSQGSKWVKIDLGSKGSDTVPAGWNAGHCKLCCTHATAVALAPPGQTPVLQLLDFGHEVPSAFLTAPRILYAWVSAQPRAPPL